MFKVRAYPSCCGANTVSRSTNSFGVSSSNVYYAPITLTPNQPSLISAAKNDKRTVVKLEDDLVAVFR